MVEYKLYREQNKFHSRLPKRDITMCIIWIFGTSQITILHQTHTKLMNYRNSFQGHLKQYKRRNKLLKVHCE